MIILIVYFILSKKNLYEKFIKVILGKIYLFKKFI